MYKASYLVNKLGACIVEGGDKAVREPLQFGLIADVDLSSIGHANCIQCASPMHAKGGSLHQLHVHVRKKNRMNNGYTQKI